MTDCKTKSKTAAIWNMREMFLA